MSTNDVAVSHTYLGRWEFRYESNINLHEIFQ